MGRSRSFDEVEAVRAAGQLFARLGYEGTSVDDLVADLNIHRGSLYRTFGSKLNLFHAAVRAHVDADVLPWVERLSAGPDGFVSAVTDTSVDLRLFLLALTRSSDDDAVTAAEVSRAWSALQTAIGAPSGRSVAVAAGVLGLRMAGPYINTEETHAAVRELAGSIERPVRARIDRPTKKGTRQ